MPVGVWVENRWHTVVEESLMNSNLQNYGPCLGKTIRDDKVPRLHQGAGARSNCQYLAWPIAVREGSSQELWLTGVVAIDGSHFPTITWWKASQQDKYPPFDLKMMPPIGQTHLEDSRNGSLDSEIQRSAS